MTSARDLPPQTFLGSYHRFAKRRALDDAPGDGPPAEFAGELGSA